MDLRQQNAKKDKTIEQHADDLRSQLQALKTCGYIENEHLYQLLEIACQYHDDGKANPAFQKRVNSEKWLKFNADTEIPHNVLSAFLLPRSAFANKEDYYSVLAAILYHHDFDNPLDLLQNEKKKALAYELLSEHQVQKIKRSDCHQIAKCLFDGNKESGNEAWHKQTVQIKGLLHKCDYSASGNYQVEYANDFLQEKIENVKKQWPAGSDWNDLQKFAMQHSNENIIMIAQTGMGKTEAGLHWIGNNKGFFVLPIRTAINAMYERVKNGVLENEHIDSRLALLHSSSLDYYIENRNNQEENQFDTWAYEQRGKNLSMPLSISTMDQLFDFVFMYPGYELKLATFGYSKFVIDEIQMYDPDLLAYLIWGLKKITQLGGKVAIMTATLAPFLKEELIKHIDFEADNIQVFSNDLLRHNIKVVEEKLEAEAILHKYNENQEKKQGNKILVVCNTIKKAQAIYEALSENVPEENLHLLHSRFTRNDRAIKEADILNFGKTYDENGNLDCANGIWVSTSLVEASLDIDFDYLFTELQELNSLFQRFGRCNRKGAKPTDEPNCYVYTEIDVKNLSSSKHGFIDVDIYNVSKEALKNIKGPLTEKEKITLIDTYMTTEKLCNSQYLQQYRKTMNYLQAWRPYDIEKKDVHIRQIDTKDIIPHSVYEANIDTIKALIETVNTIEIDASERLRAKNKLLGYAVNVYSYEWKNYTRACTKNTAQRYPRISLGGKDYIDVMECHYSQEKGYATMNYGEEIREALIF